jgi:outer membrane protein TolC
VKGQQLFYSFLPGVTAAVLTTQPALAGVMKVNGVQPASSPSVLATTDSQSLVGDKIHTQLPNTAATSFPDLVPDNRFTTLNVKHLSSNSIPVILTGNTVIPIEQIPQKFDEGRFYSLTPTSNSLSNQKSSKSATSGQQSQKIFVPTSISKLASTRRATLPLSSLRQSETLKKNPETQLPTVLRTAVRGVGAAKLLETQSCSGGKESLATVLIAARTCQNQKIAGNLLAQGSISTPADSQTTPVQPATTIPAPVDSQTTPIQPATTIPAPAGSQTTPIQPATTIPAPADSVQVPDSLIANPNLLQFPTKPEEVTLQENQAITLAQALELARRNNRDLQVSSLELERTKSALREAQAALLPTVGLSADVTRSRSAGSQLSLERQAQQTGIPAPDAEATTDFTGGAQLSYDIYTSGRRQANIRQAEEQVRFNELAVERQSEEIRLSVTTDYYNLQQADESVRISQSAVQNSQASLRDAQALERAGVGTRFDVLRSEVNLANATQDLTKALSNQEISRRTLATRLSLPQAVNISAADPVQLAGLWNQSLEQSIVLAFQNRPELQQQLAQRNISEQQRRQALASLGPQVSLIAAYNLLDQFDDNVSVVDGYSVGVRATLNLYDGGAAKARAAQAKTNIAIAETQFAEQRNQIRFQVEQAFSTKESNLKNVQTANTALEQAREALRLARLRFQAGVGTQTDVINSENDLTRSEGNRITAILDYNRALAQLQRAITSRALR